MARQYRIQLVSIEGPAIAQAGGKAIVVVNGGTKKVSLVSHQGSLIANPVALVNGLIEFYTDDAVSIVDLYIQLPTGHFLVKKGVVASGPNEFMVRRDDLQTVYVVPFNAADQTSGAETDTGIDLPIGSVTIAGGINTEVVTAEATRTIAVGTLSTQPSGSANKFVAAGALGTAGTIMSTTLAASAAVAPATAQRISYTMSTGSASATGFIKLPVQLPQAAA
jgi:hypothetical protein